MRKDCYDEETCYKKTTFVQKLDIITLFGNLKEVE